MKMHGASRTRGGINRGHNTNFRFPLESIAAERARAQRENSEIGIVSPNCYSPATVISATLTVGPVTGLWNSRSRPTASIDSRMRPRFPEIVTSETG
jgi:hypothetical protein